MGQNNGSKAHEKLSTDVNVTLKMQLIFYQEPEQFSAIRAEILAARNAVGSRKR